MGKQCVWVCLLLTALMAGCDAALTVGGRTVGVTSGKFLFTDGYLYARYDAPFERVWSACAQALTELKAVGVKPVRRIAKGTLHAVVQDEKVDISVEYIARNETQVAIRAGVTGNNLASRLLHERIARSLAKP